MRAHWVWAGMVVATRPEFVHHPRDLPAGIVLCAQSVDVAQVPDRFCNQDDPLPWLEIGVAHVAPSVWSIGTPLEPANTVIYREGFGPYIVACRLTDARALQVTARGLDADMVADVALSIPLIGSQEDFDPVDDDPLSSRPDHRMLAEDLLGTDAASAALDRPSDDPESELITVDLETQDGWHTLATASADLNNLRDASLKASQPRMLEGSPVPMVGGVREGSYSQVMWVQRHRFWHLLGQSALEDTRLQAWEISDRLRSA